MADTIIFTAIPTNDVPVPAPQTFTAVHRFKISGGAKQRMTGDVHIPYTDINYQRNQGLTFRLYQVFGSDTFATIAAAELQHEILSDMLAAECTISNDIYSTINEAKCFNNGNPTIEENHFPGFHIHYNLLFKVYLKWMILHSPDGKL